MKKVLLEYGPYDIPGELSEYWIEGIVYPVEQKQAKCTVSGPPLALGALPQYCDERLAGTPHCTFSNSCSVVRSKAQQYQLGGTRLPK
jgi:hypothetical protein